MRLPICHDKNKKIKSAQNINFVCYNSCQFIKIFCVLQFLFVCYFISLCVLMFLEFFLAICVLFCIVCSDSFFVCYNSFLECYIIAPFNNS